ncbi:MAG: SGNH/GDSL hydrolase family protein [Chitinophagaceae bacterium]
MTKKILLFTALAAVTGMLKAQDKKKDWADFPKYEAANEIVKQLPADQRKVVFMGNSITEGWYHNDSAFFKNNGFIGRGISGQVSSQMLVRFRRDVLELQPKAVVILAGTNDIAENMGPISLANICGNIISMAELAKFHGIKVVICSVLPSSEYAWSPGKQPAVKIPQLNKMLQEYCQKNKVVYADYFSKMANAQNGLDKELSGDGVHPTVAGYKIMEDVILPVIKSVLP